MPPRKSDPVSHPDTPPIPKTIKLGAYDLTVSWDQETWDEIREGEDELLGRSDMVKSAIYLNPNQSDSAMRDTLLHEAIHHLVNVNAVQDHMHAVWRVNGDEDEELVRSLTPWMLMLMRDNPDLVAYLMFRP